MIIHTVGLNLPRMLEWQDTERRSVANKSVKRLVHQFRCLAACVSTIDNTVALMTSL